MYDQIKRTLAQHIKAYTMANFKMTSSPKVDMIVKKIMSRSGRMNKECRSEWALIL